jgi:hypothetical protein
VSLKDVLAINSALGQWGEAVGCPSSQKELLIFLKKNKDTTFDHGFLTIENLKYSLNSFGKVFL